jgi:HPt (histidine-containing phosphotransfer) domain-containing protein
MAGTMDKQLPIINYDTLNALRVEMEEAFAEVYQSVFDSIGSSIQQLQQPPADGETITRLLHSIKSPAASIGAEQLAAMAEAYEQLSKVDPFSRLAERSDRLQQCYLELQRELAEYNPLD